MPPLFSLLGPVLDAGGDLGLIFRMSSLSTCSMTVQPSLLVPSVISVRDHTRMQQLAGSTSVIKGRIPKAHTTRQFGKLIRKRPGLPASGAETSAWDIPCSKYVKIIALACSLFLPYFLLVQWAPQTQLDLVPMEEEVNLSLHHLSQSRRAWSLVVGPVSGKKGSVPISVQVPHSKESSEVEKVMERLPAVEQMQREGKILGCVCPQHYLRPKSKSEQPGFSWHRGQQARFSILNCLFLCTCHFRLRVRCLKVSLFMTLGPDLCPWIFLYKIRGIMMLLSFFFTREHLVSKFIRCTMNEVEYYKSGNSKFRWRLFQLQNYAVRQQAGTGQRGTYI